MQHEHILEGPHLSHQSLQPNIFFSVFPSPTLHFQTSISTRSIAMLHRTFQTFTLSIQAAILLNWHNTRKELSNPKVPTSMVGSQYPCVSLGNKKRIVSFFRKSNVKNCDARPLQVPRHRPSCANCSAKFWQWRTGLMCSCVKRLGEPSTLCLWRLLCLTLLVFILRQNSTLGRKKEQRHLAYHTSTLSGVASVHIFSSSHSAFLYPYLFRMTRSNIVLSGLGTGNIEEDRGHASPGRHLLGLKDHLILFGERGSHIPFHKTEIWSCSFIFFLVVSSKIYKSLLECYHMSQICINNILNYADLRLL